MVQMVGCTFVGISFGKAFGLMLLAWHVLKALPRQQGPIDLLLKVPFPVKQSLGIGILWLEC
eukprot:4581504-Amphidinium_carterae.2